jgi:hypothetical protein
MIANPIERFLMRAGACLAAVLILAAGTKEPSATPITTSGGPAQLGIPQTDERSLPIA